MVSAEIFALNANLERIETSIDLYSSLQWVTSYNEMGNFELHLPIRYLSLIRKAFAIENTADHKHCGVIEYFEKQTNDDGSETLMVKGRMLESILSRRVALGTYVCYETQPMEVVRTLVEDNAVFPEDEKRIIPNLTIGNMVDSDVGAVDYCGSNQNLLDEVRNLCKSCQTGFRLYPDGSGMTLETYKGVNRTEEENTTTEVSYVPITNLLANGRFDNGLSGWGVTPHGIEAVKYGTGNRIKKTKLWDRYWEEDENGEHGHWVYYPLHAGHVSQSVTLNKEHMYYLSVELDNPTDTVLSSGVAINGSYPITTPRTYGSVRQTLIFVPDSSGTKSCVLGMGNFPDERRYEGTTSYLLSAILVDLTATFGAGNEPTKSYCDRVIQFTQEGGLQYRDEVIVPIPNMNDPLVFSRDRDNALTLEYQKNLTNEATWMFLKGDGDTSLIVESQENVSGLERKEVYFDVSSDVPRNIDGVEIPAQSYENMLRRKGESTLKSLVINEIIGMQLYLLSNCVFGEDFDLGDIVVVTDDSLKISLNLRITQVNQVWDTNGYSISIVLGEPSPDLYDTITYVARRLK